MKPETVSEDLGIERTGRRRIVIIGGGFAGLHFTSGLENSNYQIVLLDRNNHHTFQHLLYQVATSSLEGNAIAFPLRKLLKKHPDFHYRMVKAKAVDSAGKSVITDGGDIQYDYLVIATGAKTSFFGMESVAEHALPMKNIAEALDIRNRVLKNLEKAVLTKDIRERRRLSTVIIAGGGPAGVETAGAFAEFRRYVMPRDYGDLDPDMCTIYLIELLPRVLAQMSEKASRDARDYLESMGVKVITETQITDYDGRVVKTDKGDIPAGLLLWTGGVSGAFLDGLNEGIVNKKGRIAADEFGRVKDHADIFALGDVVQMATADYPDGHPQLAAVAVQQGRHLAGYFLALEKNEQGSPFSYSNRGVMANVGKKKGVIEMANGRTFKGFLPWFIWLAVHLFSLAGFKNKILTLLTWAWFYLGRSMTTNIIIEKQDK
ncbi:MAG: NAD(P)/FAD-dependent oxidoreductase [Desulfobulbaceae bacterium]|nr:NAD(P)/FAD-dependent oxidoreductase [Desulfobulbaceae bacterium]